MVHMVVVLFSLIFIAAAQTCTTLTSIPCVNGICTAGSTCTTSTNVCRPVPTPGYICVDEVNPKTGTSDCAEMATYCNNTANYTLMVQQCPLTCGFCNTTTIIDTCEDQVNPETGLSDCADMAAYCDNSDYYALMTQECPKTCGRCNGEPKA